MDYNIKNTSLEINDIIPFILLKYGLNPKRIFSYICIINTLKYH